MSIGALLTLGSREASETPEENVCNLAVTQRFIILFFVPSKKNG
jgi:hypothetical protein